MAVVSNTNQNDEQGQETAQNGNGTTVAPTVSATPGSSGGGSAAPSTGSGGGDSQGSKVNSPPSAQAGTNSGNFTNLKSYLSANQGFNGGNGLTGTINDNLTGQAQTVNSNINNASNAFNTQSQNAVNPVAANYQNFESGTGNGSDLNAIQNYASNAQNVANTQGVENATYTGPKSLNDLTGANNGQALQSQVSNYNGLVNNTNNEAGRFSLLQNMFGNTGYNQGQQTLDNAFINPQALGGARASANNLNDAYSQASAGATTAAQNNANTIQGYANNTKNQLNGTTQALGTNLQGQLTTLQGQQGTDYTNAENAINSGTIGQALANTLGLTNGQDIYNTNVGSYLTPAQLTAQNTTTADQYKQIGALQSLLGQNANAGAGQVLSTYNPSNQPTTLYNAENYLNGDKSGLSSAIAAANASYTNAAQPDANAIGSLGLNNSLYGQFGRENNADGIQFGNGLNANQYYGVQGNGLNADLSNVINGTNGAQINYYAHDDDSRQGQGQLEAYYKALQNLANTQNQYKAFNNINVTPT